MRLHLRTFVVLALAVGLIGLFLHEVDLRGVLREIMSAHPGWLAISLASMFANLVIRALRWQYLLEPIGKTSFANAFRATAVGFAARGVLPSAAGELVRPYFLSRQEQRVSATGAFATVILERLLDLLTILVLLASFVFVFGRDQSAANPTAFAAVKWAGALAGASAVFALAVLFMLAGHPEKVNRTLKRLETRTPSKFAGLLARIADKFVGGLAVIRRPGRLFVALVWSFPLWLSIGFGIWAVAIAFNLAVPFTGSFLLIAFLTIGVTVPTPGAVGGFHEAFRLGVTQFFGAPQATAVGAAIVLHAFSVGSALLLGLIFAAQAGLNLTGMRQLVREAESGRPA
jgi:uncharacterized protein (TIRG00374 family)